MSSAMKDYARGRATSLGRNVFVVIDGRRLSVRAETTGFAVEAIKQVIRQACVEAYNDGAKNTKQRILSAKHNHKRGQEPKAVWICWDAKGHFVEFTSCEPSAACFYDRYDRMPADKLKARDQRAARIIGKHSSNRCMCEDSPSECLWRSKEEILGTDKPKPKSKRRK